jgi:hypothetical protein
MKRREENKRGVPLDRTGVVTEFEYKVRAWIVYEWGGN